MIPDSTYTAVVDESEGSLLRLELEADLSEFDELVVGSEALPKKGRETRVVLTVEDVDEALVAAEYDPDETQRRRERAKNRFDRLSERPDEDG
jgi:hypothetical protein